MPPELAPVEHDESVQYLWDYFLDMSHRRTSNGYGANAISHAEVEAWARKGRVRLVAFEWAALDALEHVFLKISNKPKPKAA